MSRDSHEQKAAEADAVAGRSPVRVVGVGASAGGLESLEAFFGAMPADTGMAFVVIQHLSPDFDSMMDSLLARRTSLPIRPVQDGEAAEPDTVYLLPPRKEMIISGGRLLLSDKDRHEGLTLPIDHFFRSLAQDCGERAVAVVLSGSGSDGSRGVREVKRAGGLVLAESESTAKFNGMPASARATGDVDLVLAPEAMATALLTQLGRDPGVPRRVHEDVAAPDGLSAVLDILRESWSIDFAQYKPTTVTRRIERRLSLTETHDLRAYVALLRQDPKERSALYHDLLIGVTRFFRDAEAYHSLEHDVLPELVERLPGREPFRAWVAGCATGEEAYSIAILLHEALERAGRPIEAKVFATDVHRDSLDFASAGLYSEEPLRDVSAERLQRYFVQRDDGYQVSADLRELVVFAPHDVTRDAPFTRLDLVTCRNLLIYFQPSTQKNVLSLLHFGLKPGGCMFLGSSESLGDLSDEFESVDDGLRLYRKRRDVRLAAALRIHPLRTSASIAPPTLGERRALAVAAGRHDKSIAIESYDALLDRYMPASLLVNERRELIDSFGDANRYLQIKPRRPNLDVVDMLRSDAREAVASGLRRVASEGEPLRLPGLSFDCEGASQVCDLGIEPVVGRAGGGRRFLISFHPTEQDARAASERSAATVEMDFSAATLDHLHSLEDELRYSQENLQATIEELETSNEELQATNEELVASNEELQSTNEELHSVNEELYTVNNEYQKKISELNVANRDMSHLLACIDVATLFLDEELRIRRMTPRANDLFDFVDTDLGRKLSSFSHELEFDSLMDDLERCLASGERVEAEVHARDGSDWFLRILPYLVDDRIEGVVLTLIEIGSLARTRAELKRVSAIVEHSDDAIIGKARDGVITSWNAAAQRLYGWTREEAIGRPIDFLLPPEHKHELHELLEQVLQGESLHGFETQHMRQDGRLVDVSVTVSPVYGASGQIEGASTIARDISSRKQAERLLRESEQRHQDLYQNAPDMYFSTDLRTGVVLDCNRTLLANLGYERDDVVGRPVDRLYAPESRALAAEAREQLAEVGEVQDVTLEVVRRDGSILDVGLNATAIRDEHGEAVRSRSLWRNITERRRVERQLEDEVQRRERFLAMLSHELRNPMNALATATGLLGDEQENPAVLQHARDVICRQLLLMRRLLDDLLDMARITQGKIELQREPVDLRAVCVDAAETTSGEFQHGGIELDMDLGDRALMVVGDAARLQQVVINLLSNAGKFSPSGSRVDLLCRAVGEEVELSVRDQGSGIPAEMQERIFDPFLQLDTSAGRAGGMGLGLTLVRGMVELHGGRIGVSSEGEGKGSLFTVRLPLAHTSARTRAKRPAEDTAGGGLGVVVVEDLEDSRVSLEMLLRRRGCRVWSADDAESGIRAIEAERPDLALVDIGLPGAPGYEVARRVRANRDLTGTCLVALTGYGQSGDVERAREAGFDEHMVKPLDLERLNALLERLQGGGA